MNKKTLALSVEDYKTIIETIKNGFEYEDAAGKKHKFRKNEQLAMICQTEATTGMRIGDVLNLAIDDIKKDGNNYRLEVIEQKTKKPRTFTVPDALYSALTTYAYANNIRREETLFSITERAVQKHLKTVSSYLGFENISTHSFRKTFAKRVYDNSGYNIELVRQLLQHSTTYVTQRYIGVSDRQTTKALEDVCNTFL